MYRKCHKNKSAFVYTVTKNAVREMPRKMNIVTNVIHYKNKVSTLQNKFEGYGE